MKWEAIQFNCTEKEKSDDPLNIFLICGYNGLQCRPGNCPYMEGNKIVV